MDDKIVKTTNGYTVTLRPFITYDQYVETQKLWTKDVMIDPNEKDKEGKVLTPKPAKISANILYDADKMIVGFLVKSITDTDGKEISRKPDELPIPPADGQEVMEAVKQISTECAAAFDKKKATT
jgi:hypothetical protein